MIGAHARQGVVEEAGHGVGPLLRRGSLRVPGSDGVQVDPLEPIQSRLQVGVRAQRLRHLCGRGGVVAVDLGADRLDGDLLGEGAQTEVQQAEAGKVVEGDHAGEAAGVDHHHRAAAADRLQRHAGGGEHQVVLDQLLLGIGHGAVAAVAQHLEADAASLAGRLQQRQLRAVLGEGQGGARLGRQRRRLGGHPPQVHGVEQDLDPRRVYPLVVHQAVANGLVDGDEAAHLRQLHRLLGPVGPGVAHLHRRRVGKADQRLAGLDEMLAVDDVGGFGHPVELADHRHAAFPQLAGRAAEVGRIDDRPVAAAQHAKRQVADHALGAAPVIQPDVGEQDGERAGVLGHGAAAGTLSAAPSRCAMGATCRQRSTLE